MATWKEFSESSPTLAAAIRARFTANKHHVIATLRSDGSPRVSGTEVDFRDDELMIGSMLNAVKAKDLQRNPRYAIHSNPGDETMSGGDAKLSGCAREITGTELDAMFATMPASVEPCHMFAFDIDEAVLSSVVPEQDLMKIELWRPGTKVRTFVRGSQDLMPREVTGG